MVLMPGRAGAERLKEALGALGLKTKDTLRQRADRLWLWMRVLGGVALYHYPAAQARSG